VHELSITQAVVEAVVDHLDPDERVVRVRLEIGKLSGVVVDSVRFCFDLVTEDTPLAGALLEVDEPSGAGHCRACARRFTTDDPIVLCPGCDSADVEVLAGQDLRIRSVEVRTECARPAAAPTAAECG
jgi:hydrogenase nickel incorporation protein HypA/HybF